MASENLERNAATPADPAKRQGYGGAGSHSNQNHGVAGPLRTPAAAPAPVKARSLGLLACTVPQN